MKKIMLFEAFVNESSNLLKLGLSRKQLKTIHSGQYGGAGAVKHDTEYIKVKNKSELSKIIKSGADSDRIVVIALVGDGTVKVINQRASLTDEFYNRAVYSLSHYGQNGELASRHQSLQTLSKVLKLLGKAKDIYYSPNGSISIDSESSTLKNISSRFNSIKDEAGMAAAKTIVKDVEKMHSDFLVEIKKLAKKGRDKGGRYYPEFDILKLAYQNPDDISDTGDPRHVSVYARFAMVDGKDKDLLSGMARSISLDLIDVKNDYSNAINYNDQTIEKNIKEMKGLARKIALQIKRELKDTFDTILEIVKNKLDSPEEWTGWTSEEEDAIMDALPVRHAGLT